MKKRYSKMAFTVLSLILFVSTITANAQNNTYLSNENTVAQYETTDNITNPAYEYYLEHPEEFTNGYILEQYLHSKDSDDDFTNISLMRRNRSTLPTKYDARESNLITPVKNQYKSGTCWAYSALSTIETLLLKNGTGTFDLSEGHMTYNVSNDVNLQTGGNNVLAMRYFARLAGPVKEENAPQYTISENNPASGEELFSDTDVSLLEDSNNKKHEFFIPNMIEIPCTVENIKHSVMEYGSVATGYFDDNSLPDSYGFEHKNPYDNYHRVQTDSSGNAIANHQVVIIGWDDDLQITNQNKETVTGAFLVKNSWGTEKVGINRDGYMWISYDSFTAGNNRESLFIFTDIKERKAGVENIYTYSNYTGSLALTGNGTNDNRAVNIFKRKTAQAEKITDVSFYNTANDEISYVIYATQDQELLQTKSQRIVLQTSTGEQELKEKKTIKECDWQKIASGTLENKGFHTIQIDTPFYLTNDTFALKLQVTGNSIGTLPYETGDEMSYIYGGKDAGLYYDIDGNFNINAITEHADSPVARIELLNSLEEQNEGYDVNQITPLEVKISNTGTVDMENISVSIDGKDKNSFSLDSSKIKNNLAKDESMSVKILPVEQLQANPNSNKTYVANIKVSADNLQDANSKEFTFVVNPNGTMYAKPVTIPDENLKEFLLEVLKDKNHTKRTGSYAHIKLSDKDYEKAKDEDEVFEHEMELFTKFRINKRDIKDLTGLEKMINVTDLHLSGNEVVNTEPLRDLKKLTKLSLSDNEIEDISPLKDLTNLKTLYIDKNKVKDIYSISSLMLKSYGFSCFGQKIFLKPEQNAFALELKDKSGMSYNLEEARLGDKISGGFQNKIEKNKDNLYYFKEKAEDIVLNIGKDGTSGQPIWIITIDASKISEHTDPNLGENPGQTEPTENEHIPPTDRVKVDFVEDNTLTEESTLKKYLLEILKSGEKDYVNGNVSATLTKVYKKSKDDTEIYEDEIQLFKELTIVKDMYLVDLTGLEKAVNLEDLRLFENCIEDITPIGTIKSLKVLHLDSNYVENIDVLNNLENLTELHLANNRIKDIKAVSGLSKLKLLRLNDNKIEDISAVAALNQLKNLQLSENSIVNIDAIESLVNLETLRLENNKITDITALKNLKTPQSIGLKNNHIKDFSPLKNVIKNYTYSFAHDNQTIKINPEKNTFSLQLADYLGKSYDLKGNGIKKVGDNSYHYTGDKEIRVAVTDDYYLGKNKTTWIVTIYPVANQEPPIIAPDKKALQNTIEKAKQLQKDVVISDKDGLDVETNKQWVSKIVYENLEKAIKHAEEIYEKNVSQNEINHTVLLLEENIKQFVSKAGKKTTSNKPDNDEEHTHKSDKSISKSSETTPPEKEQTQMIQPKPNPSQGLQDIQRGAWYEIAVNYVLQNDIMKGVDREHFAPNKNTTRAMAVQALYHYAGKPAVTATNQFRDVTSRAWFGDAVSWASNNKIVNGVNKDMFLPNKDITREDMVTILYHFAKSNGVDVKSLSELDKFEDKNQISPYAELPIRWALTNHILSGVDEHHLNPKGLMTRAQLAQVLQNYMENISKKI